MCIFQISQSLSSYLAKISVIKLNCQSFHISSTAILIIVGELTSSFDEAVLFFFLPIGNPVAKSPPKCFILGRNLLLKLTEKIAFSSALSVNVYKDTVRREVGIKSRRPRIGPTRFM